MCGISGFSGIADPDTRFYLTAALGWGIDERGGHAAGYVRIMGNDHHVGRKLGTWMTAKDKWLRSASAGDTTMMHARFATCGNKTLSEAHPFKIVRPWGYLYGCHNGVIWNAQENAVEHGKKITVDSEILFEHIADGNFEALRQLQGYGVITWIDSRAPRRVLFSVLRSGADLEMAEIIGGGTVWGSTKSIVKEACNFAGLKIGQFYKVEEVGRVYFVDTDGARTTDMTGVHIKKFEFTRGDYSRILGGGSGWDREAWDRWGWDEYG